MRFEGLWAIVLRHHLIHLQIAATFMQRGKYIAGLVSPHLFSNIKKRSLELIVLALHNSNRRQQTNSHNVPLS